MHLAHVPGYVVTSEKQQQGNLFKTVIQQTSDGPLLTIFTVDHHETGSYIKPLCEVEPKIGNIRPYIRVVEKTEKELARFRLKVASSH
jgi:hypothetical protein